MKIERLQRVLKLVTMLQSGNFYTPDQLAAGLDVSRRTVFRDLNMLFEAGIPCYFDEDSKGYKIDAGFFLPPMNLTLQEALSLVLLAHHGGDAQALPLHRQAGQAALKIENALPAHIRQQCGTMIKATSARFSPRVRHEGFDDTFVLLQNAVRTRHKVKIAYDSFFEKELIETEVSPYHLHFARRAWYVIGHSKMHNEIRIFKLTRIKRIEKLDSLYLLDKPFRIDDYLGRAWSILPEGKIHNVSLKFSKLVARNVAEVLWHPTQKLTWHKDGSMTFDAQVDGLKEITWWILGYGDQVEVLTPPALRKSIANIVKKMNNMYE